MAQKIRPAAVAGKFYPGDAERLRSVISRLISAQAGPASADIRAILAPHAGLMYSGEVAASAYARVKGRRYENVFILGNAHADYFTGIALDDFDAWESPLGAVPVNKDKVRGLTELAKGIVPEPDIHAQDHNLEMHLPFLQSVLAGEFKIVPILFGNAGKGGYLFMAQAIAREMGDRDLLVVSTDLSHYPSYEDANRIDGLTLDLISKGDLKGLDRHLQDTKMEAVPGEETLLCGVDAVKTLMELSNSSGWISELVRYANSGDAESGSRDNVVGYGAMVFSKAVKEKTFSDKVAELVSGNLNENQKSILLSIAKDTISEYARRKKLPDFKVNDPALNASRGAFVSIYKNGDLRGCIGRLIPNGQPLWELVRDMSLAAATDDPRFPAIAAEELSLLKIEISVLSVPERIMDWRSIRLGKHGVIVRKGFQSGVFLPQVATETGWDLEEFLSQLCCQKAGLPPDAYKNDREVTIQAFTAEVF
jgi:MEMO1 family protein